MTDQISTPPTLLSDDVNKIDVYRPSNNDNDHDNDDEE